MLLLLSLGLLKVLLHRCGGEADAGLSPGRGSSLRAAVSTVDGG